MIRSFLVEYGIKIEEHEVNHMQVRNLRNRLRVSMVCEWAWVSIPVELDLSKSLNWCSRLELRSHVHVRTHTRTQARARTYSLLPWHSTKTKVDVQ